MIYVSRRMRQVVNRMRDALIVIDIINNYLREPLGENIQPFGPGNYEHLSRASQGVSTANAYIIRVYYISHLVFYAKAASLNTINPTTSNYYILLNFEDQNRS